MTDTPHRNVIVTGGSRGLGLAICGRLIEAGHSVIAIARNERPEFAALMESLAPSQASALHFQAHDLADVSGFPALIKGLRKAYGPIYGLVNNVGVGTTGILTTLSDARIEMTVRLNVISPILFTKHVVRSMMVDGGGGRIVNIGSIVGATGFSGLSVYGATKASSVGFTKALARELGALGITVNTVAPGFLDTEMTEGLQGEQRARVVRRSPLGRLAEISDVASAVEYLLSERAKSITGTVLTIDAGSTA